jgi:hypothetical protein
LAPNGVCCLFCNYICGLFNFASTLIVSNQRSAKSHQQDKVKQQVILRFNKKPWGLFIVPGLFYQNLYNHLDRKTVAIILASVIMFLIEQYSLG